MAAGRCNGGGDMVIGERVGAKEKAYYSWCRGSLTLCTAWFPMIEVEGRMVFLKAKKAPTGKLEAATLGEALCLATKHRDKLHKLLEANGTRSAESTR